MKKIIGFVVIVFIIFWGYIFISEMKVGIEMSENVTIVDNTPYIESVRENSIYASNLKVFNQGNDTVCSGGTGAWEKVEYEDMLGKLQVFKENDIRIRQFPSMGGAIVGIIEGGTTTGYYDTKEDGIYTWYKIDKYEDWWISNDGSWLRVK